ncbi:MAG: large conductance mechanosensitive channel protein MscL [Lachnospiraceae bacterium]|nr:large conductance mechanosensitive channel protein MscL [Lachnospiraceae bacterium]
MNDNLKDTTKKVGGFFGEFREFIQNGNVMDMAVGVIVGGAFKAIVDSLVADILMPVIGIFVGADSFASLSVTVGGAVIPYGNFISAIVNFLILAFVLFLVVKALNKMKALTKKKEEEAAAPAEPSNEEKLLTEIRDLLKK